MSDIDFDDPWPDDPACLPAGFESMPADWFQAACLDGVDIETLSGFDQIRVLQAADRLVSHFQALRATVMAAFAATVGWDDDTPFEIAPALHLTRQTAVHELDTAMHLADLPQVRDLLATGELDWRRIRKVLDSVGHLDTDTARHVIADVAEQLPGLTTGQIGSLIRRRCLSLDPADAVERLERRIEDRSVDLYPTPDGAATLVISDAPPDRATAAMAHIDTLLRQLPADDRTADQRRADIALDLLAGHGPPVGRGVVDITIDLATLIGLNDEPGTIGGFGPVVAEISRSITDAQYDADWQATVTLPDGSFHTTALRRRPTAGQDRRIRARYTHCVFPGCRIPARYTDLDHTVDYQDGGPTVDDNLAPLCRRHHRLKHETTWTYQIHDNTITWTSPTGHTHTNPTRGP